MEQQTSDHLPVSQGETVLKASDRDAVPSEEGIGGAEPQDDDVGDIYSYEPLEGENAVRLLIIQPETITSGSGIPLMQCELLHANLDWIESDHDELAYTALSYVWGASNEALPIKIGDRLLFVGSNLYQALYYLRNPNQPVTVWADGVCINQMDVKERNHQVCQMKNIYQKASATAVFLGTDSGYTTQSAWDFLELESIDDPALRAVKQDSFTFHGDLGDVENSVLQCNWFQRVWVFQEVVVSRNIWVQCGWRKVPWDSFCKVILLKKRLNDRYGPDALFLLKVVRDELLPPWYDSIEDNNGSGTHILTTLARARRLSASDERDKIFALLGVSTGVDLDHPSVAPNYGKTLEDVYRDFARYIIETTGSYDILSFCGCGRYYRRQKVESWAPDWSFDLPVARKILSVLEPESEGQMEKRKTEVTNHHSFEREGHTLCSVGQVIGVIDAASPSIQIPGIVEEMFDHTRQKFKGDEQRMKIELLALWASYPWLDILQRDLDSPVSNEFEHEFVPAIKLPAVSSDSPNLEDENVEPKTISSKDPGEISVESHLISRSRKTAFGSSDDGLAAAIIVDRSSVVDNRLIALYRTAADKPEDACRLALGPFATLRGDLIISIRGSRLPYVVRLCDPDLDIDNEEIWQSFQGQSVSVTLIGECLIDDFKRYDSVSEEYGSSGDSFVKFNIED